jgi:plastocyanin
MCFSQNLHRLRSAWLISLVATMAILIFAACGEPASTPASPTAPATSESIPSTVATSPSTSATEVQIKMVENNGKYSFSPATMTITKGTTVVWTNASDAPHTVISDDDKFKSSDANKLITENQTYSFVFNTAGTYAYHCSIHPSTMKATIIVK